MSQPPPYGYPYPGSPPPVPPRRPRYQIAVAVGALVAFAAVIAVIRSATLGSGTPASQPTFSVPTATPAAASHYAVTCILSASNKGYHETITNPADASLADITGFVVIFYDDNAVEVGSDSEPGNGSIDQRLTIQMSDYLAAGQTAGHDVVPDKGVPPTSTSCQVAQVGVG
jgi:hypothetical protein